MTLFLFLFLFILEKDITAACVGQQENTLLETKRLLDYGILSKMQSIFQGLEVSSLNCVSFRLKRNEALVEM